MNQGAFAVYQRAQVETSSPHKLVAMLYDGAIRRCLEAEQAMSTGQKQSVHTALVKAQDILTELVATLNSEAGGEIAEMLLAQYEFMYRELVRANTRNDVQAVQRVRELLQQLADTWRQIS